MIVNLFSHEKKRILTLYENNHYITPYKKLFKYVFSLRVPEAAKLAYMLIKSKESITSQKLGSRHFWQIANSVLNKGKSSIPPLFNGPQVLSSAFDKAKLFAENFL